MSEKKRKIFSGEFKAKVALEAIRSLKTGNEIAQEFGVHPTQVGVWKKELQEQAGGLFEVKRGPRPVDPSASPELLHSEIERLKMELDWLKKEVRDQPIGDRKCWIDAEDSLALSRQCELAGIARSTVYASHREVEPDPEELALLALIDDEYTRRPFYGSRRITACLRGMGYRVNRKRIRRLMGISGIGGHGAGAEH